MFCAAQHLRHHLHTSLPVLPVATLEEGHATPEVFGESESHSGHDVSHSSNAGDLHGLGFHIMVCNQNAARTWDGLVLGWLK